MNGEDAYEFSRIHTQPRQRAQQRLPLQLGRIDIRCHPDTQGRNLRPHLSAATIKEQLTYQGSNTLDLHKGSHGAQIFSPIIAKHIRGWR